MAQKFLGGSMRLSKLAERRFRDHRALTDKDFAEFTNSLLLSHQNGAQ
jgi:hypothetical protein